MIDSADPEPAIGRPAPGSVLAVVVSERGFPSADQPAATRPTGAVPDHTPPARRPAARRRLNESEQGLLLRLVASGTATRTELGGELGLSRATMSSAMKQLLAAGLIEELGTAQGSTGRPAAVNRVAESAGYALAIDLGRTRVRVRAVAVDGRTLAEAEAAVRPSRNDVGAGAVAAAQQLVPELAARLVRRNRLRRCVIAAPIKISFDDPVPADLQPVVDTVEQLRRHPHFAIDVENNVNCAAIAEGMWGAARGRNTFAYLQVGVRIGLGIVNEGRLLRGGRGGAGEVACLPFPWGGRQRPRRFGLERHLGAAGLLSRAKAEHVLPGGSAFDAEALFAAAEDGDPAARRLVDTHAREVGDMAAAVVALLDPGLIVLGGGVGQSALMTRGVTASVNRLTWPTDILTGQLGTDATIMGAARLAAEAALTDVLAEQW